MKEINLTLLLILGSSLAVFADPSEQERAVKHAENTFFRQFAQLKDMENTLLRTYNAYLMSNCINRSNQQPVEPLRDNNIEGHHPNPSPPLSPRDFQVVLPEPIGDLEPGTSPRPFEQPRPLGPRDFHVVPPGPTQDYRQVRPLGPRDFHVVPPGPTQDYRQVRPLGPRDFHIVPPGPTEDYRQVRPLGPRDFHVVPPGPTLNPALHRSSFGPRDRHVDPPGPRVDLLLPGPENRDHNNGPNGKALQGRNGEPGIQGYPGIPGIPGLSTYDVREMMIERGRILCEQRHACKLS